MKVIQKVSEWKKNKKKELGEAQLRSGRSRYANNRCVKLDQGNLRKNIVTVKDGRIIMDTEKKLRKGQSGFTCPGSSGRTVAD